MPAPCAGEGEPVEPASAPAPGTPEAPSACPPDASDEGTRSMAAKRASKDKPFDWLDRLMQSPRALPLRGLYTLAISHVDHQLILTLIHARDVVTQRMLTQPISIPIYEVIRVFEGFPARCRPPFPHISHERERAGSPLPDPFPRPLPPCPCHRVRDLCFFEDHNKMLSRAAKTTIMTDSYVQLAMYSFVTNR